MASVRPRTAVLLGCVVLTFWVAAVFGQVSQFRGAILDDGRNLLFNPRVGALDAKDLSWALVPHPDYAPRYIPLGWLVADVETSALGYNPALLRSVNLALHLVNTLLLAGLLRRILLKSGFTDSLQVTAAACLGAAAYGLHPLRAEMVGWASTVFWQAAVFWLLVAGFIRTAAKPKPALEAACYAASLLCYPAALGLAPGLLAYDAVRQGWRRALKTNLWVVLVALSDGVVTFTLASKGSPDPAPFPLLTRLEQVLAVVGRGLGLWVCPAHLTPYAKPLERLQGFACAETAGAAAFLLALLIGLSLRKYRPLLGWALLLAAAIGPFTWATSWQDPDIPDRYYVVSSLILAAALAFAIARRPALWGALAVIGVLGWAVAAHEAVQVWSDETALFSHSLAELDPSEPDIGRHRAFLELHLAIESYNAGDYRRALDQIDRTIADDPTTAQYASARAQILAREREAAGLPLDVRPALPSVPAQEHRNAAALALKDGEPAKGMHHLDEVHRLNPAYYEDLMAHLRAATR